MVKMIKEVRFTRVANYLSYGNDEEYIFEVEYEFDSNQYELLIKVGHYPIEEVLRRVERMIADKICERIKEQIRDKMNENDEILALRMMNKLSE